MDIQELIIPIWKGDIVRNETILPLINDNGEIDAGLLFAPKEILSIKSSDLKKTYVFGKDWILENGRIKLVKGSEIPYMSNDELCFKEEKKDECFKAKDGGYVLYKTKGFFHKKQSVVTYRHDEKIDFGLEKAQGSVLANTRKKLDNGDFLKICFYGDSITAGCDGSGLLGIEPKMPSWTDLVKMGLEAKFGSEITSVNTAVGGKQSDWGAEFADERIAKYEPDLAIIAFGMNDGTELVEPIKFRENILTIKNSVLKKNPNCEFIFISTTLANPKSVFDGYQREYYNELLQCISSCDTVVNMTKVHDMLLSKKAFSDLTGNNINHPNDFLIRVYAQVILELF